ncbi:MAG: hypothetical protein IKS22_03365 [Bacteroidales bacterium]|nr:hypothetical protein [Bacteroidales bacterium]
MKRIFSSALTAAIIAALAVSCANGNKKGSAAEYVIETDPAYNVPTETLLKKFPITFPSPANTAEEKGIQNRMLNGFNCWNEGFDAWKNWGSVLYSPESIYNVNGVRMTLEEYQQAMNITLKNADIQMGDFDNMIICGNWTAIRYQTTNTNMQTGVTNPVPVTEFVRFKDFGEKGMKVDEGWGGTKGGSYNGLLSFISDEEKEAQKKMMDDIIAIVLPETSDLEKKYPVLYPTEIKGEKAQAMKRMLLEDLDAWNSGAEAYGKWAETFFSGKVEYGYNDSTLDLNGIKDNAKAIIGEKNLKRVKVYNILVSEDWAAIHSWHVVTLKDGSKDVYNSMAFYHFVEEGGELKVDKCWIKENS